MTTAENQKNNSFLKISFQHIFIHSGDGELFYQIQGENLVIELKTSMYYGDRIDNSITIPYKPGNSIKENLKAFLQEYLWSGFFRDQPLYEESEYFTEEEFETIWKDIVTLRNKKELEIKEKYQDHPLIQFCENEGLNPRPAGATSSNWLANCPVGKNHSIMMELNSGTFGCGYCGKKGQLEELRKWKLEVAKQKL